MVVLAPLLFVACHDTPETAPADDPSQGRRTAVTCLGRIEPGQGVVEIGAPRGERLRALHVHEGQAVAAGDLLATLDSIDERRTEVGVRRAMVEEARQRLLRARQVGPLAIREREASVRRLESDLVLAESDLARTRNLVEEAVSPTRDLESQETVRANLRARLDEARAQLAREQRERELAIGEAAAAMGTAEASLERAEAVLTQAEIRAPEAGTVLDLLTFAGESTEGGAILRLGPVDAMYAVAEVYETDARFVRVGQAAIVESPALEASLSGTVAEIATLVHRNDVVGVDPAADTDARVLEARIQLDQPSEAARFVHLQVDVRITLDAQAADETAPSP